MLRKNDVVRLRIEDIGNDGLGIGRADSVAVFVKDTVTGDEIEARIIKVKKNYAYGKLLTILSPGACRVTPRCPDAARCGGCQIQAMDYPSQLAFKQKKVRDALERIGGFADVTVLPVIGMEDPWHYRNKAQYPVGTDAAGNLVCGFYAGRTHTIIDRQDCAIQAEGNEPVLACVLDHMRACSIRPYDETTGQGLVRHILIRTAFRTGQRMVTLVLNGRHLPQEEKLAQALMRFSGMRGVSVNVNREKTNVILGPETFCIAGEAYMEEKIGPLCYRISPASFFQVNTLQTEKLYAAVLSFADLHPDDVVWDLYCGAGTISLFLAQKAGMVYGIEVVEAAVSDARANAERNGITNARFYAGRAEDLLPGLASSEIPRPDVVVVDPPRKGCDASVLETILASGASRVVYVSCDPATLARDLKILCAESYRIEKVQPVDLFGQTVHVETVCCLYHQKKDFISVPYEPNNME